MRKVRFSMRRMMIVLALVTAIFELFVGRPARFRRIALAHRMARAEVWMNDLDFYLVTTSRQAEHGHERTYYQEVSDHHAKVQSDFKPLLDFAEHHNQLADKYESAAAHPWRRIPPDPSPPPIPSRDVQLALWDRYRAYMGDWDRPKWPDRPQ